MNLSQYKQKRGSVVEIFYGSLEDYCRKKGLDQANLEQYTITSYSRDGLDPEQCLRSDAERKGYVAVVNPRKINGSIKGIRAIGVRSKFFGNGKAEILD